MHIQHFWIILTIFGFQRVLFAQHEIRHPPRNSGILCPSIDAQSWSYEEGILNDGDKIGELEEQKPLVFVINVDRTLLKYFFVLHQCDFSQEATQFLKWARSNANRGVIYPYFLAWADGLYTEAKLHLADAREPLAAFFKNHHEHQDRLSIVERDDSVRLGLYFNGIKDLWMFREACRAAKGRCPACVLHQCCFGVSSSPMAKQNGSELLVYFDSAAERLYPYNVCFRQYYEKHIVPIIVQNFEGYSAQDNVPFYTFYMTYGETGALQGHRRNVFSQYEQYESDVSEDNGRWKFHEVRVKLEKLIGQSRRRGRPITALRLVEHFPPPGSYRCAYSLSAPARLHTAIVVDLGVIDDLKPAIRTRMFSWFLTRLFAIEPRLIGNAIDALLFSCISGPKTSTSLCMTYRRILRRIIRVVGENAIAKSSFVQWISSVPVLDVIIPRRVPRSGRNRVSWTRIKAVEYGIGSRLPQKTTIMFQFSMLLPSASAVSVLPKQNKSESLSDELSDPASGSHVCYSKVLAKTRIAAKKVAAAAAEHASSQIQNVSSSIAPHNMTTATRSDFFSGIGNEKALRKNQKRLHDRVTSSFLFRKKRSLSEEERVELSSNPLTHIEFLSEFVEVVGLLKHARYTVDYQKKTIASNDVEHAMKLMESKLRRRGIACYSL